MSKRSYPLRNVYQLLEPGPVLLVTTAYRKRTDVMALSWQTMVDFDPPLLALVVSDKNESFEMLQKSRECVLNIPTAPLLKKVVQCGTNSMRDIPDKFTRFGLTPKPASSVKAPHIEECYANIECKVIDSHLAQRYNMFILKVSKAWVDPAIKQPTIIHHCGRGRFRIAGRTIVTDASVK